MSGESIPSGVLKVAEECKRLAAAVIEWDTGQGHRARARRLHAAIDQLAALASPPAQATGALSEPLTPDQANNVWRRWIAAGHVQCDWLSLLRLTEAAHGITAASKVEPEEKHG